MQYKVTSSKVVDVELSAYTRVALDKYRKVKSTEKRLAKLEESLQEWVDAIPQDDMIHYVRMTEEIDKQFDE